MYIAKKRLIVIKIWRATMVGERTLRVKIDVVKKKTGTPIATAAPDTNDERDGGDRNRI